MPPGRDALTGAAPLSPIEDTRPGSAGRLGALNNAGGPYQSIPATEIGRAPEQKLPACLLLVTGTCGYWLAFPGQPNACSASVTYLVCLFEIPKRSAFNEGYLVA